MAHNFGNSFRARFYDRSNATIRKVVLAREHAISNLNRRRPSFPPFLLPGFENKGILLLSGGGEGGVFPQRRLLCRGGGRRGRRRAHIGQNTRDLYLR